MLIINYNIHRQILTYFFNICIFRIILDADDTAYTIKDKFSFCVTTYYIRLLTFCILLFGSIWVNLFIIYENEPLIFSIINCGIITAYLSIDWYQTAFCTQPHITSTKNQLLSCFEPIIICFKNRKNSFGLTLSTFSCFLSLSNWILFIIYNNDKYNYRLFWIIMICLYLIVSLILEIYHFRIVFFNAFCMESSVTAGIYSFVGIISRPTFRLLHCLNRYLIMIIWIIFGGYHDNKIFIFIIYPSCICSWYIGSFFQRSRNRPSPKWIFKTIWRKYVEYLFKKACDYQSSINANFKRPKIKW